MKEDLIWPLEGEWYTEQIEQGFETQNTYHKSIFGESKVI